METWLQLPCRVRRKCLFPITLSSQSPGGLSESLLTFQCIELQEHRSSFFANNAIDDGEFISVCPVVLHTGVTMPALLRPAVLDVVLDVLKV